jgi:hypothetical protein
LLHSSMFAGDVACTVELAPESQRRFGLAWRAGL